VDQLTFPDWLERVDQALVELVGLTHRDLVDQTWFDWFESEYTPLEAAQEALAQDELFGGIFDA